jgi:CIC family chloride channel protein
MESKSGIHFFRKFTRWSIAWQKKHIGSHTYLLIASSIIGICSALAAVLLKMFVEQMHRIPDLFYKYSDTTLWYIVLPLLGILLTVGFVKVFLKGKLEKGLGPILFSIFKGSSKISKNKIYSHIVTSGFTVGLGGSAGLEAPIVVTGSAIGSNLATFFNFGQKDRTLLLACGAASGIAAVFNCPIAGVIFAIEVLLTDVTIPAFIPLLISTASSIIVSKLLYKGQLFYLVTNDWAYNAIPFYAILGIICGFLSVYMTRITIAAEGYFELRKRVLPKAIVGGLSLGVLIFLLPPLYGEGYSTINSLLRGNYQEIFSNSLFITFQENPWLLLIFTVIIVLFKVFATSLTIGAGGNGGIFAPSLFTGALTGFGLAFFVNTAGISKLNVQNFIVVGMAGIMSGVVHAPLTAIFLIAEITGGYVLFVPLMIVAAIAFFISRFFEPYTIYTKNLAKKGHINTGDKDSNILRQLNLDQLIETDFVPVLENDSFPTLIEAFTKSKRNFFPVVDAERNFIGIIQLESFKEFMFRAEMYNQVNVSDLIIKDMATIDLSESMETAINKFEQSNLWNLPVVDGEKYIGFISRSNILSYYRRILKKSASMF